MGRLLSPWGASALLTLYALIYVIPFYLFAATRPSRTLRRDDPSVIAARIRSVSYSTTCCCAISYAILFLANDHVPPETSAAALPLRQMGLWPLGLSSTAYALALTALLFAGPLYESVIIDQECAVLIRDPAYPLRSLRTMTTFRNIIAGPATEEILFRSAAVPLMVLANTPVRTTIFVSPLIFGLAHAHHFYEFRLSHPHTPLVVQLARSVLQLSYTTLFGAYATFIFLRTGSLLAVFVVHAFCNWMGLPRLWGWVGEWRRTGTGDEWERRVDGIVVIKTLIYYLLLVGGAVGCWKFHFPWTESPNALVDVYR